MIGLIIFLSCLFTWLLYETDWLRVRLLRYTPPAPVPAKLARYTAYNGFTHKKRGDSTLLREGSNLPAGYSPNSEPCYNVYLNPDIDNVLCGWDWLDLHCAAMVYYQPQVYLSSGNGVRYTMTIRQPEILPEIMKVNRMTKRQRTLAYA